MAAPFSRLQLAAALLEYDNDPTNPDVPYRSAHDSAIFAHLRRNFGLRQRPARNSDYLGVSLPSETGSLRGAESVLDKRRSRGSSDALQNPFAHDTSGEEDSEVDLTSWGLDAFIPKDSGPKSAKGKSKSAVPPHPHPLSSVPSHQPQTNHHAIFTAPRRAAGGRSMSLGNVDAAQYTTSNIDKRRRSIGSPLDLPENEPSQSHLHYRRPLSHSLIEAPAGTSNYHSVPFPTSPVRSVSPSPNDALRSSRPSHFDRKSQLRERSHSNPSIDSRTLLQDHHSGASPADDNPFALRPPSNASRFDPKATAHARTLSNASIGSRMLLDNDGASAMTGPRQYSRARPLSTLDLLRPKVLVMPSPLQQAEVPVSAPPVEARPGFQLSSDGPPLPPGARSSRYSAALSVDEPMSSLPAIPIDSLTPNPRMDLSLSQLTFRNTLLVGGQRDVAYSDIDGALPRATEDGEQVHLELHREQEELPAEGAQITEDPSKFGRPAGKLFGKSLIDDLENRKAQMRNKQRVFKGDQRPSMMARGQLQRASTLIDPASLQARPVSHHMNSFGSQNVQQPLARRNSNNAKPLLSFDDDDKVPQSNLPPNARMLNSRSVFGVDTLWEREMTKLHEIEAQEKIEVEERRKKEAEKEARELKKRSRKAKRDGKSKGNIEPQEGKPRVSAEPPVLPAIQRSIRRPPPPQGQHDSESEESDESVIAGPSHTDETMEPWFAGSSDDEESGPRRTTGIGPRYPSKSRRWQMDPSNESDEDIPLSAAIDRAVQRATRMAPESDDDDEKPLSSLLQKSINFDRLSNSNGRTDDDDEPLGLRASRAVLPSQVYGSVHEGGDDDDRPLAFHPEQQRRTQNQMIAQQQQQQMMLQAQLHNSMFFAPPPPMMGFFNPPMAAPMMMPPMQMPSPPPMHDAAKYGRVDRWRRDVAVEGDL